MQPPIALMAFGSGLLVHGAISAITDITLIVLLVGIVLFLFGLLAVRTALVRREISRK